MSDSRRYLSFSLGQEIYAIPLLTVREVIPLPELTPVPFSKPYFLGIMNLRGQVLSVIDLRKKLGIEPKQSSEKVAIICDIPPFCLGAVVDSIESVLSPSSSEISEKPDGLNTVATEFITGVYNKGEQLVLFLDIARCLEGEGDKVFERGNGK